MKPEVPSPAGFGVGDVNFPRTRLLCDGCPPLGWVGWISNTRTRLNENFGTPRCHVFKYKDWIDRETRKSAVYELARTCTQERP